ncbi:MAG: PAS domain S-box protein [Bacteroidia bacterium]|nr:PAS domain S-box protein [Bacteroidia bacterium]
MDVADKKAKSYSRHKSLTIGGSQTALRVALFIVGGFGWAVGYFLKIYYPRILLAEQIFFPAVSAPIVVALVSFLIPHVRRRLIDYGFISFILIYLLLIFLAFHNHLGTYFVATLIAAQVLLNISFRKIPEFLLVSFSSLILFGVLAFSFSDLEIHPNLFLSVMGFATIGSGIFVWLNQKPETDPEIKLPKEEPPLKTTPPPVREVLEETPRKKETLTEILAEIPSRDAVNYAEIFNAFTDAVLILKPENTIPLIVNPPAVQITGFSMEEFREKPIREFFSETETPKLQQCLEQTFAGEVPTLQTHIKRKNGSLVAVFITSKLILLDGEFRIMFILRNAEDEVRVAITRNIADRVFQEEALRQSEQKYRTLVERMNEGLILTDNDETILFVNDRLCEIMGMTREEVVGKRSFEVLMGENTRQVIENKSILRRQGISDQYELQTKRNDGETIWLLIAGTPYVDPNEDLIGTIAIVTDISDRKLTEIKLQEKNNELDAFVYKASHDLKGPLASIIGVTNIAREEVKDTSAHRYFDLITKSAHRLDGILTELLDLTRINKASLVVEPVDIAGLIDEIIHSLRHLPQSEKVSFITDIQIENPFPTDKKMLVSIFQNLIVNAVNYQNNREEKPFVRIHAFLKNDKAVFKVEDNGVGIPEKIQSRVFEMFYRGNTLSKGSGLGLYLVKSALEKLRGNIELQSEPGVGSIFTVTIPPLEETLPTPDSFQNPG